MVSGDGSISTAEAFNLLNHPNVVAVNAFYGSGLTSLPSFGFCGPETDPVLYRFRILSVAESLRRAGTGET